jgi:hypothetical protein
MEDDDLKKIRKKMSNGSNYPKKKDNTVKKQTVYLIFSGN